ncbi:hypothetical protein MNV49_002044 [Pseudohyphozyma bogoriensis]|nr:hypothetical protein MNV49_002044 [Pseudohyphozyma bogoriensis]
MLDLLASLVSGPFSLVEFIVTFITSTTTYIITSKLDSRARIARSPFKAVASRTVLARVSTTFFSPTPTSPSSTIPALKEISLSIVQLSPNRAVEATAACDASPRARALEPVEKEGSTRASSHEDGPHDEATCKYLKSGSASGEDLSLDEIEIEDEADEQPESLMAMRFDDETDYEFEFEDEDHFFTFQPTLALPSTFPPFSATTIDPYFEIDSPDASDDASLEEEEYDARFIHLPSLRKPFTRHSKAEYSVDDYWPDYRRRAIVNSALKQGFVVPELESGEQLWGEDAE